jgi:ppGpp synthetase/RelA/SpoT-type nucleotidyltranferase
VCYQLAVIVQEYDRSIEQYQELSRRVEALLVDLLKATGIRVHQVTARVKSRSSLERKLSEKPNKYKQLTDITDISGFRVIVYFEDDVDRDAEVTEREYQVDLENTVDKRQRDGDRQQNQQTHQEH